VKYIKIRINDLDELVGYIMSYCRYMDITSIKLFGKERYSDETIYSYSIEYTSVG